MSSFIVSPFTIDNLIKFLSDYSVSPISVVKSKSHITYFDQYFSTLKAKTIVVEESYVDHDYLEDYAAYYVKCFEDYKRVATRLHFFDIDFTEDDFRKIIVDPASPISKGDLQKTYLGFIVVKPLPMTIIGRTCLKTYSDDNGRRNFPILREYKVSLYGIPLTIRSLAYQEQDTVVAACATSALWSCFQGTGKLFQHAIPSPVEITKAATINVPENLPAASARAFPNSGLTATQMALAVRDVGLEPFIVGTSDPHVLKSTLYAYLRFRIPSIFTVQLNNVVGTSVTPIGRHAVAVTGFSLGASAPVPFSPTGFLLKSSRIDKIYAHDDQVGPFARMVFTYDNGGYYLATSHAGTGTVRALPWFVMLPLYHKIRIPFSLIHDAMLIIDSLIEPVRQSKYSAIPRPEWDIYLSTVNDYKLDIFNSMRGFLGANSEEVLTAKLPRFLWRATAWCGNERHLELVFDATGIAQHQLLIKVIELKPELPSILKALSPIISAGLDNLQAEAVLKNFA